MSDLGEILVSPLRTLDKSPYDGVVFGYNHRLSGTVSVNTVATSKPIIILQAVTCKFVTATTAAADGTWTVKGLAEDAFTPLGALILAIDPSGVYNAEAADRVQPVGIGEPLVDGF